MDPQFSIYHDAEFDVQQCFDIAVVIPTIFRDSLSATLRSIFLQDFKGRIHILLGVDKLSTTEFDLESLLTERPKNIALSILWPGYSTGKQNGGLHGAMSGGALRSLLSFLGNAHYITYLDDDNWFATHHLSSLYHAIQGKKWAYSNRWFIEPETLEPLCEDSWESVGPNKGVFTTNFGGFVDTNCLMIDTRACATYLSAWCHSLTKNPQGRGADRYFFAKIKELTPFGQTHIASVSYVVQKQDSNHKARIDYINDNAIPTGRNACKTWTSAPKIGSQRQITPSISGTLKTFGDFNTSFDIAVVIPTIGRDELQKTIRSVYEQSFKGRVQILIGVDKILHAPLILEDLSRGLPDNMALMILDPSYSTSARHGGVFQAHDGGAMRTILSFLAHANYVAYLDDDNHWKPHHLSTLHKIIQDKHYAYSLREFIHPDGETPISIDYWESVGPQKGFYAPIFKGFIDPNCLMLNLRHCINLLPRWTQPLAKDKEQMSADRVVFSFLSQYAKGVCTDQASVNYVLSCKDPLHKTRCLYLAHRWINANFASMRKKLLGKTQSFSKKWQ